jgi:serine/threonine protein phosphatase PrpC
VSPEIDVDALSVELDPGDQLLLCSDGLTGVLEDDEIARELATRVDPDQTLKRLIDAANEGGGPDNITAVLLRYGDDPARRCGRGRRRRGRERRGHRPFRRSGPRGRGRAAAPGADRHPDRLPRR